MINWKLRLKNKTTLIALILGLLSVIYQILEALKVIPNIEQSVIKDIVLTIVDLLCILGIVVDPTTAGVADSERANSYTEPYKDNTVKQEDIK